MKTKIVIGLLTVAAILVWAGIAGAQAAPATPKVQLPSGETVWDLSGDWEAQIENYGPWARYGTYTNVFRITQTGNAFSAIRLNDNPPPPTTASELPDSPSAQAGSRSVQGELEKTGFKHVELVTGTGGLSPSTGQISEDGKKIVIDNGRSARVTLIRR